MPLVPRRLCTGYIGNAPPEPLWRRGTPAMQSFCRALPLKQRVGRTQHSTFGGAGYLLGRCQKLGYGFAGLSRRGLRRPPYPSRHSLASFVYRCEAVEQLQLVRPTASFLSCPPDRCARAGRLDGSCLWFPKPIPAPEAAFLRAEPRATRPGLPLASSLRPTRHRIAYSKRGRRDPPIAATSWRGRRQ
jgi:hypothetical protein